MATGDSGFFHALGQIFLPGFDHFGVFDAFFAFELGFKEPQEVVDDAHGDALDALACLAGAPRFAFVEFLLLLVEGFFDVPAQPAALIERSGRKGHLIGQGDVNFLMSKV